MIHIQDSDFHPFPGPQCQAAAALVDGQLVRSDVTFVNESWMADADVDKSAKQSCVVYPARQDGTHPQITHRHDALFEICLPKIWGWQRKKEAQWFDASIALHVCAHLHVWWLLVSVKGDFLYDASTVYTIGSERWCTTAKITAVMKNTYCMSYGNRTPVSAYFYSSQHSFSHRFPLGLFGGQDRFPFCTINTNKEGLHPRK